MKLKKNFDTFTKKFPTGYNHIAINIFQSFVFVQVKNKNKNDHVLQQLWKHLTQFTKEVVNLTCHLLL